MTANNALQKRHVATGQQEIWGKLYSRTTCTVHIGLKTTLNISVLKKTQTKFPKHNTRKWDAARQIQELQLSDFWE